MADREQDDALREMARHRGLKLVKSRRRKPGVGDYGKFGLTDAKTGEQCFGFGKRGLTASAEDIASYLRGSAAASWKQSAETTPARPMSPKQKPKLAPAPGGQAKARSKPKSSAEPAEREPKAESPPILSIVPPKPEVALKIRKAAKGDADAVAGLMKAFGTGIDPREVALRLRASARNKEAPLVADRGGVIGCIAWHIVPTLHEGPLGRIAMIVVAEAERRQGVGRALVDAVVAKLARRGCSTVEAMSDIAINNAHGFFRRTGFEQTSYRFARPTNPGESGAKS